MKINEVSKKYHIASDTLRYWERVGAIPAVTRDSAGYRNYDNEDLDWVSFAMCMRDAGVSVEYLIDYISLFKQGKQTVQARKELLNDQLEIVSARLAKMQKSYNKLKYKVDHYEKIDKDYEGKMGKH
ncbi:MerR family transcriptional regulator [Lentilactobacillus otakiensis]|uniref:MerR family transcriptional regulator n=1 Tax=Lentilactobacillus otakiensis DSM 19908 = JCM 15040 TaxID=1423780 RepID=S4NKW9_9LACO|nr:MerR family transcriptional regulator [Lentilactobacillus otakiensis]KRL09848.1 MerR family transcriptional regulator [Lentilactobacillus otakiensis DSM 19908 = JCM 15040]MBZ3776196.1 MerR family transcriptional regulator [Lentilactobacillus otakiensis]MDV3517199.1 MerR family transcriptional regulator [Lentilactobacillus otakiensis]GAD16561.1 merR family transcriptional regulator [Lentilactobacillus otakiensis DSM 19908 = JCM 15040]